MIRSIAAVLAAFALVSFSVKADEAVKTTEAKPAAAAPAAAKTEKAAPAAAASKTTKAEEAKPAAATK